MVDDLRIEFFVNDVRALLFDIDFCLTNDRLVRLRQKLHDFQDANVEVLELR